jgi:hypothetical protein
LVSSLVTKKVERINFVSTVFSLIFIACANSGNQVQIGTSISFVSVTLALLFTNFFLLKQQLNSFKKLGLLKIAFGMTFSVSASAFAGQIDEAEFA